MNIQLGAFPKALSLTKSGGGPKPPSFQQSIAKVLNWASQHSGRRKTGPLPSFLNRPGETDFLRRLNWQMDRTVPGPPSRDYIQQTVKTLNLARPIPRIPTHLP